MKTRAKINIRRIRKLLRYILMISFGVVMVYPLVWMVASSFKSNVEIFGSPALLPKNPVYDSYSEGWKGSGQYGFGIFFINSFRLVTPYVIYSICSSVVVGYGFARFQFIGKKILFAIMISTMMLPDAVLIMPRYIMFKGFGWINSYKPFTIPALFAGTPFFVFLVVQFIRGIPTDLDESAKIDGYDSFRIFLFIILPLCKPAIFSIGIFAFIWTWNDFFNSLIFINSVSKFTVPLGLRISIDTTSEMAHWNEIIAMSVLSIIPPMLIFFLAQKYFVEGIATTGLKN